MTHGIWDQEGMAAALARALADQDGFPLTAAAEIDARTAADLALHRAEQAAAEIRAAGPDAEPPDTVSCPESVMNAGPQVPAGSQVLVSGAAGLEAYGDDGLIRAADGSRIPVRLAAPGTWVIAGGPCRCTAPFAADPASHADTCPRRAGPPYVIAGAPSCAVTVNACACGSCRQAPVQGPDGGTVIPPDPGTGPDWAAEFRAVLDEPLGLPGEELDELLPDGTAPPGTCRTCLRGPVYKDTGQCLYCRTLTSQLGFTPRMLGCQLDWQPPAGQALHRACAQVSLAAAREAVARNDGSGLMRSSGEPEDGNWRDSTAAGLAYRICDHGGRGQRFVRDGHCRRCGQDGLIMTRPVRYAQYHPGPGPGRGMSLIAAGAVLLALATYAPGLHYLIIPGVFLFLAGIRGRRR
jgi:hypothetical protein